LSFTQCLKMALKSILANKIRSILTMLGTIIGVGSVIALMSIGQGTTNSILDIVSAAGTDVVTLTIPGRGDKTLEPEELEAFVEENPDYFLESVPVVSSKAMVKYGNKNTEGTTSLTGTGAAYQQIRDIELESGRYITDIDVAERKRNVVIGTYVKNELFDGADPIGQTVKINGEPFNVVGVLEETGSSKEGSADDAVVIPYSVATRILGNSRLSTYVLQLTDENLHKEATALLESHLLEKFSDENAYRVIDNSTLIESLNDALSTMVGFLAGIAAISLLVAGIGIMNIMLVSVTERTREIGIRKTIGAKRKNILLQFLVEAVVISSIGGIVGILVGIGLGSMMGALLGITAVPSMGTILLSFGFSMAMGIFFGFHPANKASKLNPIDALKFE